VTWTIPISGSHTIWVDIDPQDLVAESDEDNNQRSASLCLDSDLLPTLSIDPPSLFNNDRITITTAALAENAGPVGIPPGAEIWFWMDEPTLEELAVRQPLGPLAASETTEVTASLTVTSAGVHTITVMLDPTGVIAETDETNNYQQKKFLVPTSRIYLPLIQCQ
jgi:subtilase family serine protease